MDTRGVQEILGMVQNYIRNMSKGPARMDIGALEEAEKEQEGESNDKKDDEEEYLGYMGKKGKGKGKGIKGDCWNCGKTGHRAADCKGKGKGEKGGPKVKGYTQPYPYTNYQNQIKGN
eukprot:1386352-Karenia_brevis.AAC.1